MSIVINTATKTAKRVKNLGWIIRHRREIERLIWLDITAIPNNSPHGLPNDGLLIAHLYDGRVYVTTFASKEVFEDRMFKPLIEWSKVEYLTLA